jgi:hypothetical protein
MKKSKTILFGTVVIALLSITLINGCKKNDNAPDPCANGVKDGSETAVDCGGNCNACAAASWRIKKVTAINSNGTFTDDYTYDNKGQITSHTWSYPNIGAGTETYTYNGNIVTNVVSGITTTYTLNSNGYAESEIAKDASNAIISSTAMTYDAQGHLAAIDGTSYGTWTDGNLTFENNFNGITNTYLTDKANTIGNANKGQGFLGKDSKNLIDVTTTVSGSETFAYEFDSQNRVSKVTTASGGNADVINYTYY